MCFLANGANLRSAFVACSALPGFRPLWLPFSRYILYQKWKDHYGKNDDDVLVVRGTTMQFNPSFNRQIIDAALEQDPQRYGAEYLSC